MSKNDFDLEAFLELHADRIAESIRLGEEEAERGEPFVTLDDVLDERREPGGAGL